MNIEDRIKKINMMSPGMEKKLEIFYLNQYSMYLQEKGIITKNEVNRIKKEIDYKNYIKKISCEDMEISILQLTCLYYEILSYANNFQLFWTYPKINYHEYLSYAKEFLKYMDLNLYKIYQEMEKNNLITIINDYSNTRAGATYHIGNGQSSVIMDELHPFYQILTMIHEMGHVYHNFLTKNNPSFNSLYVEGECLSSTFELLFFKFLRNNHLGSSDIIDAGERCSYMNKIVSMNNAYLFNYLIIDNRIKDYDEIKKTYFELNQDIYNRLKLIKFNARMQNDNYRKIKNYDNNYAYGLLFALIIEDIFSKDEEKAKNILKTFPNYANTHEKHEIIERFTDEEYLHANKIFVDRVLSKTYYKTR